MKSDKNIEEVRSKFQSLLTEKSELEGVSHDAFILMAGFLSEIEEIQKKREIKRNNLAKLIKTSASYLTQVFRGDKPLNFHTIAKIQRALGVKFSVHAHYANPLINNIFNGMDSDEVNLQTFQHKYFHSKFADVNTYQQINNSASSDSVLSLSTTTNPIDTVL